MASSISIFFVLSLAISAISAGIVPAAYIANYASSYTANAVNHALAAPVAAAAYVAPSFPAAPLVAAPAARIVAAAPAPLVAAPAVAAPALAAYSAPFAPLIQTRVAPIATGAYGVHPY